MGEMRRKLKWALGCYAGMALLAAATLRGGMLWIVLVIMAAFAVKSWIAVRKEELEAPKNSAQDPPRD